MVGVARTVGARRIGGDAGGSKGSVRGNEFGVRGGENFFVGDKRVHHRFVVGDGGFKVVHDFVHHFHEGANWGRIAVSLAPVEWPVEWWQE